MKKYTYSIILFSFFYFFSCVGNKPYLAPDGQILANQHEIIAILPPSIFFEGGKKLSFQESQLKKEQDSRLFQEEIYNYLLKRKSKGQMFVNIQDVQETNVLLSKNELELSKMTNNEICTFLDVDALLTSQFTVEQPDPIWFRIFIMLISGEFNWWDDNRDIEISLGLKDCSQHSLIWKYDDITSGGTSTFVVNELMRRASKKMPYFIK